MKLIPSKKQWNVWTLPSKTSYVGVVLTIIFFLGNFTTYLYYENLKLKSEYPKLVINFANKPFLRYEVNQDKISFSYELSIKNKGKNTATDLKITKYHQKLMVDNQAVVEIETNLANNKDQYDEVPSKLVSGEKFFKIFRMTSPILKQEQLDDLKEKYKNNNVSIILDIQIEYKDEFTGDTYSTKEILDIHKKKVRIIKAT